MTETSPVGGMAHPPAEVEIGHAGGAGLADRSPAGSSPGSRCASSTTTGDELPWDGEAVGEIEVRGPWITGSYYRDRRPGEVPRRLAAHRRHRHHRRPRLLPDHRPGQGRHQVRRRVDLLGRAGEPADRRTPTSLEAAVIGIPDERWAERPLACVVRARRRRRSTAAELAEFLAGKVARVAGPGELDVHRRGAQDHRRQVRQEGAARAVRRRRLRGAADEVVGGRWIR